MNTDREILCVSTGQNPNSFQVKFPKNIAIHPNSEIALIKGRTNQNFSRQFDATNSQFVLLWGQYNMENAKTAGLTECTFLTPDIITLEEGIWNLKSISGSSAGDSTQNSFTDRTILNNLVDSLNEQSLYFNWQWAGEYTATDAISIFPYNCPHIPAGVSFVPGLSGDSTLDIQTDAQVVGVSAGKNRFVPNASVGGYTAVTNEKCTLAYSYDILPAGVVDVPRFWHYVSLPVIGGSNVVRFFGGVILAHQETNKQPSGYVPSLDWCGIPLDAEGSPILNGGAGQFLNQMPISYEIRAGGVIYFIFRDINADGTVGDVITEVETPDIYDGTVAKTIQLRPKIVPAGTPETTSVIECLVGGTTRATFILDAKYHKYELKHAMCNDTNVLVEFIGIDESNYIKNTPADTLGPIDRPTSGAILGNINMGMFTSTIPVGTELNLRPDTTCNIDFNEITRNANTRIFERDSVAYYFFNGQSSAQGAQVAIELNIDNLIAIPDYHICVENIPLESFHCNGIVGQTTYRIFSHYQADTLTLTDSVEPFNIIYHKLHNKQTMMLDHLRIRVTDNENRTYESLINTTILNLHIRTNPHSMIQALTGAIANSANKKETVDNTERIQRASEFVF